MDKLPNFGTAVGELIMPTYQTYAPLLIKNQDKIRSTKFETFTYGPNPRQQLDLYTPLEGTASATPSARSVLLFMYGGGFVRGDKSSKEMIDGLVYTNLGHYFTKSMGIDVAVVDYRLLTHGARFPSGGEDVQLALQFLKEHYAKDSTSDKPVHFYIMGSSAGGINVSTYLLAPHFEASRRALLGSDGHAGKLKGAITLGCPFARQESDGGLDQVLEQYYGDRASQDMPLGLLRMASKTGQLNELRSLPLLTLTATLDPEVLVKAPNRDFANEWRKHESVAKNLQVDVIEGHNHISHVIAVGTGIPGEEAWAKRVEDFIVECSRK